MDFNPGAHTDMTDNNLQTDQVLTTLRDLMQGSESDTARIQAAKILLERLSPKQSDEEQKHQAEERDHALAEARGLLTEFAALKLAGFRSARELDQTGAREPADPAG